MIISLESITKYYGADLVLKEVTQKIEDTDRIGLIGVNGAGKSTLLNIINGDLDFEEGTRALGSGVTIGFLRQNAGLERSNTILEEMRTVFAEPLDAQEQMNRLHLEMEQQDPSTPRYRELEEEYNRQLARFEAGDGYQIDVRINTVLNGMGFAGRDRETRISHLSGGEKTRLALCKLLLESPDLLILDEPTNHLDFKALLWLEDYLKGYKGALLIVSHDRFFLDALVTSIWEVDRTVVTRYPGNYSKFVQLKEEWRQRQQKLYDAQQQEIGRLQEYVDRNIVRATSSKSAKSKRKVIEHMELVEKPNPPVKLASVHFEYEREPVKDVLHANHMTLTVGSGEGRKTLFTDMDLDVLRGEKIAIIGSNGIGKSSLLGAILGLKPLDKGTVTWGKNTRISYYEQENTGLHDEKTVLDELWDRYPRAYEHDIRTALGNVLITGEEVYKKVESLSGGERAKLKFAILMLEHPNVLILDEPTNHLDLDTKEVLDKALCSYTGTIIMVSHDRYLLSKAPTAIVEMDGHGMHKYKGNYHDYVRATTMPVPGQQQEKKEEAPPAKEETASETSYYRSKKQRAADAQRKRRLAETEAEIEQLEARSAELEELIATPEVSGDYQKLTELLEEMENGNKRLEELYELWGTLSEQG